MADNYSILIEKLDAFIRKYYKNQLLRGTILSFSAILLTYVFIIVTDHFFDYSATTRSFLFYSLIIISASALLFWIINPMVRFFRLGKVISHEQAATIVGDHFPEVKDKVVNTLQLKKLAEVSPSQVELLQASINQKVVELKPVPFTNAIDLRKNKKYLKFVIVPLSVIAIILFAAPGWLSDGTARLVNHDTEFEPKAPFEFVILNEKLEAVQQGDFKLEMEVKGETVPGEVYIETGSTTYKLEKDSKIKYHYTFKNLQKDITFRFSADGFYSKEYTLKVLPNPALINFEVQLDYPRYTGMLPKTFINNGDITVPEGTKAKWIISTKNTDELIISFADTQLVLKPSAPDKFTFSSALFKTGPYAIRTKNKYYTNKDSLAYYLTVIPDQYPDISVEEQRDSTSLKKRFFTGEISDDYGFTKLTFHYKFLSAEDSSLVNHEQNIDLPVNRSGNIDQFIYYWDLSSYNVNPGDEIEYYFVVYDNDGVHGAKSTKSVTKIFKAPTLQEISDNTEKNNDQIKNDMEAALKEAQKLNRDMQQLKEDMLNKKNLDWQEKAKIENLLERQMNLQQKLDNIKQQNELNNLQKTEFSEMNEELLEKQRMLEEMFEKLMTPEMKKMYEELQKLLEQLNKDKVQEKMEKLDLSNKELEKELDRSLELFKQMEFEQKANEIAQKLDELSKKQNELSEQTKDKKEPNSELEKKQEELNKEFDEVRKDMDELEKLNEELKNKKPLEDFAPQEESIESEMKKSSQELSENKNKKASESQKKSAEEMKKMKEQMESMMQSMQAQQNEEDMDAIRQLLENIIKLSFDQEDLLKTLGKTNSKDQKYVKLGQEQRKLKDIAKVIEDSLMALSQRQMAIQSIVNKEIAQVNSNMQQALANIGERKTSSATANQQYVMTSLNNLALLLDQALQQMQQQMNQGKPGSGSCNKPGKNQKPGSKPNPNGNDVQSMKKMQEELSKSLEKLKKEIEQQGKNPGNKNPGKNGNPGMGGEMSKELAEMAAKQEAIRKKMMEMSNKLNEDGTGSGNGLKKIAEQMEKNQEDIVNKNITQQTLMRQQEILTRLLESEKALREREQDEKRKSNESKNEELSNSFQYLEYKRKKEKEVELLRTIPPALTPYYKNRVNEYFNTIEK
ncbi:MAG: DUF4175 family protein [Bacteroidota bacterium]